MKLKLVSLSLLLLSLIFVGCAKEEIFPEEANPAAAVESTHSTKFSDVPEGSTCCDVFGEAQQIIYWEQDIQDVLNCCYTESLGDLGLNCTYWGTATETVVIEYQFPGYPDFTEGQVNGYLSVMAAEIENNNPGPNWMADSVTWTEDYGCPATYRCFNLSITYRKFICQEEPVRG